MKKRRPLLIILLLAIAIAVILALRLRRPELVLTGIVTTDEVVVGAEIEGRLQELDVQPGDAVKPGQLIGVIAPAESKADLAYFENLERSATAQVAQAEAELKFQNEQTAEQVNQAAANLAATEALVTQAEADANIARSNFERADNLHRQGVNSPQEFDQARSAREGAQARVTSLRKQVTAAEAALSLAKAGAAQVAMRQAALAASRQQLAAAAAQKDKAGVRLGYTQIHSPIAGIVNVRAALTGEVVMPGQAVVTLIDPGNLWVRVDVEESYIDQVHLGDRFTVRLPSGAEREGTVYFRGVDGDYATQRDVSRTKRDIKTFEVRLRCDNHDRSLAVGMTAYVIFPLAR